MKKSTKILLIATVCFIALGAILTLISLFMGVKPAESIRQGLFSTEIAGGTIGISYEERGEFDDHDFDFQRENDSSPEGRYVISPGRIHSLQLDWIQGGIELKSHSGSEIILQEESEAPLTADTGLVYSRDGGALKIRFCDDEQRFTPADAPEKKLTVLLPEDTDWESIEINAVKDDISLSGLEIENLIINSADADSVLSAVEAEKLRVSSVNGGLNGTDCEIERLNFDTVSGKLELGLSEAPERVDVNSVSGNVRLSLPADSGFDLKLSSLSGTLESELPYSGSSGSYRFGSGGAKYKITTVSGELVISKN